jgi:tellurite resistance protein TehA-like permease
VSAVRGAGIDSSVTETEKEKTDRQLIELLTELRVALPGAQVLLGFLLTAPLASRFGRTSELDRALLYVCTVITAAGVLMLMAPSVYHRIRWAEGGKQDVIEVGHRLFLIGTCCLAVGLLCAVFVIGDVLFGIAAALAAAAVALAVVLVTWYVLPVTRGRDPDIQSRE